MSLIDRASLESKLTENQIIVASRNSGLLKTVIDIPADSEDAHVVVKYSLADSTLALRRHINDDVESNLLTEWGARAFQDSYLIELADIFCEYSGCQDDPHDIAKYISNIKNWTTLWFLNAFGEVAREVSGLDQKEFYHDQGATLIFTDKLYTQAKQFGPILTPKILFDKIAKSSKSLTNISEFRISSVSANETRKIKERISFPEYIKGKVQRVTRTRDSEIFSQMKEVYGEYLEEAAKNEIMRTEGVLLYAASALDEYGYVICDEEFSTPSEAIFYTISPSLEQRAKRAGKFLWSIAKEKGVFESGKMFYNLVTKPIRDRLEARNKLIELTQTWEAESLSFAAEQAQKAKEIQRLKDEAELQRARADEAEANARAELAEERATILEVQNSKERAFNRKILKYVGNLIRAAKGADRHAMKNKLGIISSVTQKLYEHPLDTYYEQLETQSNQPGLEEITRKFQQRLAVIWASPRRRK